MVAAQSAVAELAGTKPARSLEHVVTARGRHARTFRGWSRTCRHVKRQLFGSSGEARGPQNGLWSRGGRAGSVEKRVVWSIGSRRAEHRLMNRTGDETSRGSGGSEWGSGRRRG